MNRLADGNFLSDVFRDDGEKYRTKEEYEEQREKSVEQFPRKENKYLKVPPVFND